MFYILTHQISLMTPVKHTKRDWNKTDCWRRSLLVYGQILLDNFLSNFWLWPSPTAGGGNLHPRRAPCELLGEYTSQGKPKIPPADSHTARRLHINIDGIPLFNSLCLCLASSQLCPTSWWKRVSHFSVLQQLKIHNQLMSTCMILYQKCKN